MALCLSVSLLLILVSQCSSSCPAQPCPSSCPSRPCPTFCSIGQCPFFCPNSGHCPKYTKVSEDQDFEERQYEPSSWISTTASGPDVTGVMDAHKRLKKFWKDYKSANTGVQVDVKTWPVLLTLKGSDMKKPQHVIVSWLLHPTSSPLHPLTPLPRFLLDQAEVKKLSSSTIREEIRPEATVYVRKFPDFPTLELGLSNFQELISSLDRANRTYDNCSYVAAGYDPALFLKYYNEVWIHKHPECKTCEPRVT